MKIHFSLKILLALILVAVFGSSKFTIVDSYDNTIEKTSLEAIAKNTFEVESPKPKNIWYIGIPKKDITASIETSNICAKFRVENTVHTECLDTEEHDKTDEFYTFPVNTGLSKKATIELVNISKNIDSVTVYSMNTKPIGKKLAFRSESVSADPNIISRRDWGADESIRYVDNPLQKSAYKSFLAYSSRPKTESELKSIQQDTDIEKLFKETYGNHFATKNITRYENGHLLFWPIQRVEKVNRIVIHHTSESLDKNLPDEELIRAIYMYHAVSRGWGDIGYNYIIGQQGKIYEGRAGGPYVVGAHAAYNNIGSVGISVLGNYETNYLNSNQKASLENAIAYFANKYGINLNSQVVGLRKCPTDDKNCYPLQKVVTPALLGHKDVGYTDCPGKNIYALLPAWRKNIIVNTTVPVLNPEMTSIEPKPLEQILNTSAKAPAPASSNTLEPVSYIEPSRKNSSLPSAPANNTPVIVEKPKTTINSLSPVTSSEKEALTNTKYFGNKFRVLLSYPKDLTSVSLSAYGDMIGFSYLDFRRKPIYPNTPVSIAPLGNKKLRVSIGKFSYEVDTFSFSAPVVSIDSWIRKPDWDTSGKINDNLFRDTIQVINQDGKLLVVNHIPLEYYLRGLGEVSNGDLPEKIKTIIVAARSYADYYMDSAHRKYNTTLYDGSDDPDTFQKYIGYSYEKRSPNVVGLVQQTAGEKIYYNSIAIKPWYFSVSNGRTLSYSEYCKSHTPTLPCEDIAYLQSVDDPAGKGKTQSGHGVGISGIGATYLASQGYDYKKIITYYLTGVEVRK